MGDRSSAADGVILLLTFVTKLKLQTTTKTKEVLRQALRFVWKNI
ncbi:MAG: hypothetical protein ACI8PB_000427 [Desulforhopalus sp.]|jgi:hypothetical protein